MLTIKNAGSLGTDYSTLTAGITLKGDRVSIHIDGDGLISPSFMLNRTTARAFGKALLDFAGSDDEPLISGSL